MDAFFRSERRTPAPEFSSGEWLNHQPLQLSAFHDRAVIVYFWDYASLPSLRILGQLRQLQQRYDNHAIAFIGVHTPVFSFERERQQVELAAQEYGVTHPLLLDNDYAAAQAYHIPMLPSIYLIDHRGFIREVAHNNVDALEHTLRTVLRELDPVVSLPNPRSSLPQVSSFEIATESSITPSSSLDLYTGLQRGVLGNPEGYAANTLLYRLPQRRRPGRFYVDGAWRAGEEYFAYEGRSEGTIRIPYDAVEVYAVFSPHHDLVERLINPQTVALEIWQDDRPIDSDQRGDDLTPDSRALVERPRVYHLVRNRRRERHELTLRVRAHGFSAYLFSLWGTPPQEAP